jgi:hypothetical protein
MPEAKKSRKNRFVGVQVVNNPYILGYAWEMIVLSHSRAGDME